MVKLILHILIKIVLCLIATDSYAQTYFGSFNGNNTGKTTQAPRSLFQPKTLSPDEYKSAVEARYQQYQQELANQVKKQLAQPPPSKPSKYSGPVSNLPTTTNPPISNTPAMQAATPCSTPTVSPPSTTQILSNVSAAESQEQTQQESVYTGFQSGNSKNQPAMPKSSKPSGGSGWDINY